jgi:transposase
VADRVADGNRSGGHGPALLQRLARRRRAAIEADITRIEAALAALIAAGPAPGRTRPASCKACPASLRLAAATRPAEAPELGRPAARQIAALAGLAPVTRESGTWRGKATIQGGRRPLRRALTMPTLTAIRRNRDLAALFTRLSAAGKPPGARPCRGNAQTPPPRQHTPARRTGLAGHKARTKPLTNTDTGLCFSRTCRSVGDCPARAGKRDAFPVPAR